MVSAEGAPGYIVRRHDARGLGSRNAGPVGSPMSSLVSVDEHLERILTAIHPLAPYDQP